MPAKAKIDTEELRRMIEDEGLQHRLVAERLGVSRDTIGRLCSRLGLKTHRTGPRGGSGHPNWKGGVKMLKGYLQQHMPEHPNAAKSGYVAVHRLVMERSLGRLLLPTEVVHHRNRDRLDNRIENLEVFDSNADHLREELDGDPIHALCCGTNLPRTAILDAIRLGDVRRLTARLGRRPYEARRRAKLVRRACESLGEPVPEPFASQSTT